MLRSDLLAGQSWCKPAPPRKLRFPLLSIISTSGLAASTAYVAACISAPYHPAFLTAPAGSAALLLPGVRPADDSGRGSDLLAAGPFRSAPSCTDFPALSRARSRWRGPGAL